MYPHTLTGLNDREACTDTVYRVLKGFDHHDVSMLDSGFEGEDVTLVLGGNEIKGLSNIKSNILDLVGPMATTHTVSNVRVDIKEGGKTATFNAYALAQHCPPGTGLELDGRKYLAASEYFIDLVKVEDGSWKVKKWEMNIIWQQGDHTVMQRPS